MTDKIQRLIDAKRLQKQTTMFSSQGNEIVRELMQEYADLKIQQIIDDGYCVGSEYADHMNFYKSS